MIGQSLGRYSIEAKLGEGGMGVVFQARDTQLERIVAIKILPPDSVCDPDRKRRFALEARAERKVADVQPGAALYRPISLSWCPDASCVVVTDSPGEGKRDAVFAIAIDTAERRQLTFPPDRVFLDMDPAISPDGRWLVFRRDVTPFTGDLYRVALKDHVVADGEPAQVTFSDSSTAPGKPSWLPGSREVVFAAKGALWRIDALTGGSLTRLPFVGQDGVAPVVTRRPDGQQRLVYVRSFSDSNVWRLDVSEPGAAASPPRVAIGSTRRDDAPSLSPDGRRLVFVSNRSGESEFWVADVNGGNALQLTSLASVPGFGRWSPDGSLIAFHSDPQKRADILVVASGGGKPRIVTADTAGGGFPSFSRNGQWIYFSGPNGRVSKGPRTKEPLRSSRPASRRPLRAIWGWWAPVLAPRATGGSSYLRVSIPQLTS